MFCCTVALVLLDGGTGVRFKDSRKNNNCQIKKQPVLGCACVQIVRLANCTRSLLHSHQIPTVSANSGLQPVDIVDGCRGMWLVTHMIESTERTLIGLAPLCMFPDVIPGFVQSRVSFLTHTTTNL